MAHGNSRRRASGGIFCALLACCALTGCATAAKARPTAAQSRAELLKKLSPAEIMQAADEAARRGDYERAITLYNQAIEAAPSAELWYRVAWIYARLGKKDPAAQAYAMTLKYEPRHAQAHEELGLLYLGSKERDKAAAHLQAAVESDPARWRAQNALGVLADTAGDHGGAVAHYQAALAVKPDSAMLLNNLGYSYYLDGNLAEAEPLYKRALELEPRDATSRINLGLLEARRGNYALAIEIMGAVMDVAKANNDVGYVAFQNGELEVAERLLREAIRLAPSYYENAQQNLQRVTRAREALGGATPDEEASGS